MSKPNSKLDKSPYRQRDEKLRDDIIALIEKHHVEQGSEKMLKGIKLKIKDVADQNLYITSIEMSWQFKKVRKNIKQ